MAPQFAHLRRRYVGIVMSELLAVAFIFDSHANDPTHSPRSSPAGAGWEEFGGFGSGEVQ